MSNATQPLTLIRPSAVSDAEPRSLRTLPPPRRRRPRIFYGVVAVAGAILITAAQMTLSIYATTSTYQISSLTQARNELGLQAQILGDELAGMYSPQYLASNAASLGMVIGAPPSYLRLSDGAIIGSGASASRSTVDANGAVAVPNELLTTPDLPPEPQPEPVPPAEPEAPAAPEQPTTPEPQTPPILDEGIPTPQTH